MRCPDGHKWWKCAHPELARPFLGKCMMATGILTMAIGLGEIFRV